MTAVFGNTVLDLAAKPSFAAASQPWKYTEAGLLSPAGQPDSHCAWKAPDHYLLQCKIQLDPQAVFTLAMRQTEEAESGYRLTLWPAKQEAELRSAAYYYLRRVVLDASRPITIQAFVQGSMVETFINDQYAFSGRAYDYPTGRMDLIVRGGQVRVLELKVKTAREKAGGTPAPQG